jgi:hypothetical protein
MIVYYIYCISNLPQIMATKSSFEDTLYNFVGTTITNEDYGDLMIDYNIAIRSVRDDEFNRVSTLYEQTIKGIHELAEREHIERCERDEIERTLRPSLLCYFDKLSLIKGVDLAKVNDDELLERVRQLYPKSDINKGEFFQSHKGAKLVYSYKVGLIKPEKQLEPMIDKYIQYNQQAHPIVRPFKTTGKRIIENSIQVMKSHGVVYPEEAQTLQMCAVMEKLI